MTRRRGRADQEARARLVPLVASGLAICARCHTPILPTDEWDAGHVDDLALGGHPAGPVAPEHRRCNRAAGARLGNTIRTRRGRVRLADWLNFFPVAHPTNTPERPFFLPTIPALWHPTRPDPISPTA